MAVQMAGLPGAKWGPTEGATLTPQSTLVCLRKKDYNEDSN